METGGIFKGSVLRCTAHYGFCSEQKKAYKELQVLLSHSSQTRILTLFQQISDTLSIYHTFSHNIRPSSIFGLIFYISTTQDALLQNSRIRTHPLPLRQQCASTSNHPLQRWPMHPARDRFQIRRQHPTQ